MENKRSSIPAATILLLREKNQRLEIFMVERHHKIDAFSGALVFPGGKVDDNDTDQELRKYCRGGEAFSEQQKTLRIAAIREAFEECGILMAFRQGDSELIDGETSASLADARLPVQRGDLSMTRLCRDNGLELAIDELCFFAHWITPKIRPKIFDTFFFIAPSPADQAACHDGREALNSMWISPADAIEKAEKGEITLVFPTRMNLGKLATCTSMQEALDLSKQETITTVQPEVELTEQGNILSIPAGAGYGAQRVLAHRDGKQFIVLE